MGASKAALILMKNSHFDRTPQYFCVHVRRKERSGKNGSNNATFVGGRAFQHRPRNGILLENGLPLGEQVVFLKYQRLLPLWIAVWGATPHHKMAHENKRTQFCAKCAKMMEITSTLLWVICDFHNYVY